MTREGNAVPTNTGNSLDQSVALASDPAFITALKWEITGMEDTLVSGC